MTTGAPGPPPEGVTPAASWRVGDLTTCSPAGCGNMIGPGEW